MEKLTDDFIAKHIPKLGFGAMRLPLTDPNDTQKIDIEQVKSMADAYIASGMNYFDTAYMYHGGQSEAALKKALVGRYDRKEFFLADKMPLWYAKQKGDLRKIFNEQLQRCGVDYFDFYLLHSMDKGKIHLADKLNAFQFMQDLQKEGKARFIGFSFHDTPDVLEEILAAHPEMSFVQLQINYLDWYGDLRSDEYYRIARKYNKPIIVMEPVRGGSLANLSAEISALFEEAAPGMSAASWAIRYCASLPGVMTTLSGMSNIAQLKDNIAYMKALKPLNEKEHAVILQAVGKTKSLGTIPCTACGYCADCPEEIEIARILAILNQWKISGNIADAKEKYAQIDSWKKADQCVECRQCEQLCPQHIQITDHLKKAAGIFAV